MDSYTFTSAYETRHTFSIHCKVILPMDSLPLPWKLVIFHSICTLTSSFKILWDFIQLFIFLNKNCRSDCNDFDQRLTLFLHVSKSLFKVWHGCLQEWYKPVYCENDLTTSEEGIFVLLRRESITFLCYIIMLQNRYKIVLWCSQYWVVCGIKSMYFFFPLPLLFRKDFASS